MFLRRHGVLEEAVADEWEGLLRTLDRVTDDDALRGVEGRAARLYFEAYARLLRERGARPSRWTAATDDRRATR